MQVQRPIPHRTLRVRERQPQASYLQKRVHGRALEGDSACFKPPRCNTPCLVHTAQHGIDAIDLRCHAADLSKAGDDEGECRKNAAEGEGGLGDDSKLHFATEVARRNDEPGQHQREVVVRVCEERQVSAPHDGLPGALCQTCEAALSGGRLVRLARKKGYGLGVFSCAHQAETQVCRPLQEGVSKALEFGPENLSGGKGTSSSVHN
mmetsp:Transcript_23868/g.45457  ORF Transcript_23868/g.45457 Transcript_23868/m.45457 type:complete len:207 (-) Transcript_23868:222-842(-)